MSATPPSPSYVHGHAEPVLRSHRSRTAANSAAYLLPRLRPGQTLLDIGCGPGTITADLARLVGPAGVTAVDISSEAVQQARATLAGAGVAEVDVRVGDVYALELPDGSFDVVHAHQVLQHLPDPVAGLRAMRRMCAPGGTVAARDGDYAAFTWFPADPLLDRWLALYRALARAAGGEPDAGRRMLHWARTAGFTEVRTSASVWCYADDESRAWWGGLWADRITDSAIGRQAVDSGEATVAELRAIRGAWQRWAAAPDGWFIVPHGEILCTA
jgi:ubiquinone/menaquinone biosynthesis C-methylase UbiE